MATCHQLEKAQRNAIPRCGSCKGEHRQGILAGKDQGAKTGEFLRTLPDLNRVLCKGQTCAHATSNPSRKGESGRISTEESLRACLQLDGLPPPSKSVGQAGSAIEIQADGSKKRPLKKNR